MKTKSYLIALLLSCAIANVATAQSTGDYKSNGAGGGAWNSAATWLTYDGAGYVAALKAPSAGTPISIQSGDTVSISSAETLSGVTVDSSALLQITNGKTATLSGDVVVNGAFSISGTLICNTNRVTGSGAFTLRSGATLHIGSAKGISASDTTGNIQTVVRAFSEGANYVYTSTAAQVTGDGLPSNITGTVIANNANQLSGLTVSQNISLKSPGSFIVPASRVLTCKGTTAITGSGNFLLNSGATFYIGHAAGISNTAATGCIQVTGTRMFSADAHYSYNGTSVQVIGNALPASLTGSLTIINASTAGAVLSNNIIVNTPGRVTVTGALSCATHTITGSGTFNLNAGAILLTAHASGISATGAAGTIQTAGINYNASATYSYNGTVGQVTGTGLPAAVAGLAISNTAGVKLTTDVTITNNLILGNGTLCLNGHNLTVAAGKTVTKQAGTISLCSGNFIYAGPVNLTYSGANNISPGMEMTRASGVLNTLTIALNTGKILTLTDHVTVNGSVTMTSGALAAGGYKLSYAPGASLIYNGTAAQTVSAEWPDNAFSSDISIRNTSALAGVALNANKALFSGTLTVRSGAFFNSGAFLLTGSGNININTGGTFITRHAAGVSPEGAVKLTGTRIFANGSSYNFNGTVMQETGREMPASVANLIIGNTAATNPVVTLTDAGTGTQTISGSLVLAAGILDLRTHGMNLLFHSGNTPISRAAGVISLNAASSLQFGGTGSTAGAAFTLPDNLFTDESPALNNLTIQRTNPITLGNQSLTVNGTLFLNAGVLDLANTTLTFQNNHVPVYVGSGSVSAGAEASLQFGTAENTGGADFVLPNTFFTTPPTFANLTINRSNRLVLSTQHITLTGSLHLKNGALHIGGNTLQLNGTINTGNGTLHGGPLSGLTIGGAGGSLTLPHIAGGLKTLTIARPNRDGVPSVKLGADLSVDSLLNLSGGSLGLVHNNLTLPAAAVVLNTDAQRYIVTDNSSTSGGRLIRPVATMPVHFPVGTTSYTPAVITNTIDTLQLFQVRVFDGVLSGGTAGAIYQSGANLVHKTWAIEKVASDTGRANITLQWNAVDEATGFNRSANFIAAYKANGWDTADVSAAQELLPSIYTQHWSGAMQQSLFSVQNEKAVAFANWMTFGATKNGPAVDLEWTVGNAKGTRQFEVERSLNKVSFYPIGTVASTVTITGPVTYYYSDEAPAVYQTSYYRLKQVGNNGQFKYSDTVRITADRVEGSAAYPVPVVDKVNIALHAKLGGWAVACVTNATGKRVKRQPVYLTRGSNVVTVPMQDLPKGIYFLQVIADGVIYNVHKIVK